MMLTNMHLRSQSLTFIAPPQAVSGQLHVPVVSGDPLPQIRLCRGWETGVMRQGGRYWVGIGVGRIRARKGVVSVASVQIEPNTLPLSIHFHRSMQTCASETADPLG